MLNKQRETIETSVTISCPDTPCNLPCRTGFAVDNMYTLLKFNYSKTEIAGMTLILSHQGQFSFKWKQSKVV